MRFYKFMIPATGEEIRKKVEYAEVSTNIIRFASYEHPLSTLNEYMSKNIKSDIGFCAYREENDSRTMAVFGYDDKKYSYTEAYDSIWKILNNDLMIGLKQTEAEDITAKRFYEYLRESERRDYGYRRHALLRELNLSDISWIFEHEQRDDWHSSFCTFEEKILEPMVDAPMPMYDKKFVKELNNILSHELDLKGDKNIVHYIISGKSKESLCDMVMALSGSLYTANRISSKRITFIRETTPRLYKSQGSLETIIENNTGGVIVFDLTEQLGFDPIEYNETCIYLEQLLKQYRNQCLFIFTYDMDNPGFSYYLLPNLKKYIIPVALREGQGNRESAISYLKELIKKSEFAEYAYQAEEFMELFPGKKFSQTNVLMAYEQFDAWCINKNILKAYDYKISDDFFLERDDSGDSSYEKLQKMIGLKMVKEQIDRIIATDIVEKERKKRIGTDYETSSMHMIFSGNPGTAKTTVARLFAGIGKEKGILKSGIFVERGGIDLDGTGCVGRIRAAFKAAKGGVLFIDEAYEIYSNTAATTLIQELENKRDEVIVVFAGYKEKMEDFLKINEGMKSRIPFLVDFPDYSADELSAIFEKMLKERGFKAEKKAKKEARYIFDKARYIDDFGNGRYVRNLLERAILNQSERLFEDGNESQINNKELFLIKSVDISSLEEGLKYRRRPGEAKKELEALIGLTKTKEIIEKARVSFKLKRLCLDKGLTKEKQSLHMVFTGNPGTAKTTVARLFAEIMRDEAVLPTGNFVEVGRADLIGHAVGTTAPLVKKRFKEAKGGVLFIDEAYSLCDGVGGGYGDEAINTIVQEMENHRDDVIVIFAGYPDEMEKFLDKNPGLRSRIAFNVGFEDYSLDELMSIAKLMVSNKSMSITRKAIEKLKENLSRAMQSDDYGNGRYVRKVLEEAEMNLAARVMKLNKNELTDKTLTTIEKEDIPEFEAITNKKMERMGF